MFECGIFHHIKIRDGFLNESNVRILDNTHQVHTIDKIYESIDCELEKKLWASKDGEPFS